MDHNGLISSYDYIANSYGISSFIEAVQVTDNFAASTGSMTCDSTGSNQCYKSRTWTFPVRGVTKSDLTVLLDDNIYTNFNVSTNSAGDTQITFGQDMTYYGGDPLDDSKSSSSLGVLIKPGSAQTGVITQPEYDYSGLGETWSAPRIIRLPNQGAGDTNVEDDIYVAVMGGGFGAQYSGFGSNLTIVNLEDTTYPGRVHKIIPIEDLATNDIVNSTPGAPVVITSDTARGVSYRGALVYLNDLEGKITKFNLTNMSNDGNGNAIALYDNTTLFTAGSNSTNGRYMYHSMDATIGQSTNSLWLYAGTGDYERIGDTTQGVQNLMLGINDPYYPMYRDIAVATGAADLTQCSNTTNDSTGANCPQLTGNKGWYITLDNYRKVTAEPTVSSGLAYFPLYQPSSSVNACSLGDAFICAVDDECGTNVSSRLGTFNNSNDKCFYVGQGVLSRIVTFAGKLFANIAGQSTQTKKDLVTLDGATGDVTTYRSSWKQNY
jgi:type IV pilus assembly protein PilY1